MKKIAFLLITVLYLTPAFAQEAVEMGDKMRSEGKIYVVVAIIMTVLSGLLLYVLSIERRVTRLEKRLPGNP